MKNNATLLCDEDAFLGHIDDELKGVFRKGARVLVKLHMGEPGNSHCIKASFVAKLIGTLSRIGCRPFLFDTPVTYSSPRNNPEGYLAGAAGNGYTEININAPIVVSDEHVIAEGKFMKYELASGPLEADGVFLLSHFKGHMCSGMGGAIKNVGMGCMSKATKAEIHAGGMPVYTGGCTECGACAQNCPTGNIRIDEGRPWFDVNWCPGCSNCVYSCPAECIKPKTGTFDTLLAEAAVLAHARFRNVYAVNVLKEMTRLCDCMADPGPVLAEDIGFVCGRDMLSVDIASLELLKRKTGRDDLFMEHNKVSSWRHVREASRMMGRDMEIDIDERR